MAGKASNSTSERELSDSDPTVNQRVNGQPKQLRMASSIEELKSVHTEQLNVEEIEEAVKNGTISSIIKRIESLYKEATRALLLGEHELAFVKFWNYLKSCDALEEATNMEGQRLAEELKMPKYAHNRLATVNNIDQLERQLKRRYKEMKAKEISIKPLYLANSLEELASIEPPGDAIGKMNAAKTLVEYDEYFKAADSLFQAAIRSYDDGDQELTYVLLNAFMKALKELDDWPQFRLDLLNECVNKEIYDRLKTSEKPASQGLNSLEFDLRKRYEEWRIDEEARMQTYQASQKYSVDILMSDDEDGGVKAPEEPEEPKWKPLYMARSVEELNILVSIDEMKKKIEAARTLNAYQKVATLILEMYDDAMKAKSNGDQELAYVRFATYVKWCSMLEDLDEFETEIEPTISPLSLNQLRNSLKEALWADNRIKLALTRRYKRETSEADKTSLDNFSEGFHSMSLTKSQDGKGDHQTNKSPPRYSAKVEVPPRSGFKPIYMADSLNDLNQYVEALDSDIMAKLDAASQDSPSYELVLREAEGVFKDAINAYQENDQELAYIKFSAFLRSAEAIEKALLKDRYMLSKVSRHENPLDGLCAQSLMARDYQDELKKSLENRYGPKESVKPKDAPSYSSLASRIKGLFVY